MDKYQVSTFENIVLCILAAILGSLVKQVLPNLILWMLAYFVLFILLFVLYRWVRTKLMQRSKRS